MLHDPLFWFASVVIVVIVVFYVHAARQRIKRSVQLSDDWAWEECLPEDMAPFKIEAQTGEPGPSIVVDAETVFGKPFADAAKGVVETVEIMPAIRYGIEEANDRAARERALSALRRARQRKKK